MSDFNFELKDLMSSSRLFNKTPGEILKHTPSDLKTSRMVQGSERPFNLTMFSLSSILMRIPAFDAPEDVLGRFESVISGTVASVLPIFEDVPGLASIIPEDVLARLAQMDPDFERTRTLGNSGGGGGGGGSFGGGGDTGGGGSSDGGGVPTPGSPVPRLNDSERVREYGDPNGASVTTVDTPWGIRVQCNSAVVNVFKAACEAANANSHWKPKRMDSRAVRRVRGGNSWSLHSWALAWDIFATPPNVSPPGGVWTPHDEMPATFYREFTQRGFTWGGTWQRRDTPHIEWAGAKP